MSLLAVPVGPNLEQHQPPVMGARRGADRRRAVGGLKARELAAVRRADAGRGIGQSRRRRRAKDGVARSGLGRQHEVAGEGGAARQFDDVAGVGAVERRLQVLTGSDADRDRRGAQHGLRRYAQRSRQHLNHQGEDEREYFRFHGPLQSTGISRPGAQRESSERENLSRGWKQAPTKKPQRLQQPLRSSRTGRCGHTPQRSPDCLRRRDGRPRPLRSAPCRRAPWSPRRGRPASAR